MLRRLFFFIACVLVVGLHSVKAQVVPFEHQDVKALLDGEKYTEAKKVVESKLEAGEEGAELYYWKGTALFETGDYQGANDAFFAGVKEKTRYPFNHVGIARVFIQEGKTAEAQEKLEKAQYYDKGKNINVKYAVAAAQIEAKEFKKAEVLLLQAQKDAPDDPQSYVALGDYYYQKGVAELALDQYLEAVKIDPNFVLGYVRVGTIKIDQKEYDNGAEYLNKAIALDPTFAPPYKVRGELWLKAKVYDKARDDYKKYVELAGNDLAARIRYASFLFLSEQYEEAVAEIETISEDTLTNVMLRLAGMSYLKMGELDKAKVSMDKYFANMNPKYTIKDDYEAYGRILLAQGNRDGADENFEKVVGFDVENIIIYRDLAKEFQTTAKAAKKAKNEEYAKSNFSLEAHYSQLYLDKKEPKSLKDYYTLAKAYYYADEYDKAIENFDKVIELKNDYLPPYQYKLQIAYKEDEAIKAEAAANGDTTAVSWKVIEPCKAVITLLDGKAPTDLKKSEKRLLLTSLEVMANYAFNPTGGNDNYNCEAAQEHIDKILAIDPAYDRIKPLIDYCDQFKNGGGR